MLLSPDDSTLATCHDDHSIHLWDVAAPKLREILDGLKELTGEERRMFRLALARVSKPRAILRGHANYLTALAFHPDGKILASASHDRTIKLWDMATGEVRLTLEGLDAGLTTLAFTPDGNLLISCDQNGGVKLWRSNR